MASIDFHPSPVNHAPSPFGFGFGLSSSSNSWASPTMTPGHTQPAAFHQLASTMNYSSSPLRVQKRRYEPEEEYAANRKDESMDRSPTPERPKRATPKRARVQPSSEPETKDGRSNEGGKSSSRNNDHDIDVGMLLASLPAESLLPLLNSLLNAQPTLKSTILPLIPRPTLETATRVLAQSAKKLRDAYPYSNNPTSFSQTNPALSFGFGSIFGSARPAATFGNSTMGFGKVVTSQPSGNNNGGMRDEYILSRLRPHITEFVSTCMSYLPYFSYIPTPSDQAQTNSSTIQSLQKDRSHPSETFRILSALTSHFFSQPTLTQTSLGPLLLPRLLQEWKAWVDRIDVIVNRESGMFGSEAVRGWERELDQFAEAKGPRDSQPMREIRDQWVAKVGWLIGRTIQQPMEEEL